MLQGYCVAAAHARAESGCGSYAVAVTRRMSPARAVLIGRTTLGTLSRTGQRWLTDPGHRAAQALVGAVLVLPTLPKRRRAQGEAWAPTLVRDTADILPA